MTIVGLAAREEGPRVQPMERPMDDDQPSTNSPSGDDARLEAGPEPQADLASPGDDAPAADPQAVQREIARLRAELEDPLAVDTRFAPTLDAETAHFGEPAPAVETCQWCNAPLPDAAEIACPNCGSLARPVTEEVEVPGLTTMSTEARAAIIRAERARTETESRSAFRPLLRSETGASAPAGASATAAGVGDEALQPPDDRVRAMMTQIELEAYQADPARDVEPSPLRDEQDEALEA
ncbi:MAG: hypothetical protein ACR2JZ_06230 [Candidatus Limnocylindrales bacterium]